MASKLTADELADPIRYGCEIEKTFAAGVRDALIEHKRNGNSVATWRDGQVVIVPAEEIVIPPDPYSAEEARTGDRKEAA